MPDVPMIPLSDVVRELRSELLAAMKQGKGEALRFKLKPVEMEFTVGVTGSIGGKAGIKFWVLDVEANAKRDSSATHKIKLVLEPVGEDGREPDLIADARGQILGGTAPDPMAPAGPSPRRGRKAGKDR